MDNLQWCIFSLKICRSLFEKTEKFLGKKPIDSFNNNLY